MVSGPVALTTDSLEAGPTAGGKQLVRIDIAIENLGPGQLGYSPVNFRLIDATGASYVAGAPGTDLPASSGGIGLLARARIAFEVPANARGLTLTFDPTPVPAGYQTIRIALGEL